MTPISDTQRAALVKLKDNLWVIIHDWEGTILYKYSAPPKKLRFSAFKKLLELGYIKKNPTCPTAYHITPLGLTAIGKDK